MNRVDIWHFQFRVVIGEKSYLIDDRIVVESGATRGKVVEMAKAVFEIPANANVEQRFCMRDHNVVLPVAHLLLRREAESGL